MGAGAADQILNGHLAFNLVVVILTLPLVRGAHGLALRLLSTSADVPAMLAQGTALDDSVLDSPSLALANVTREVVGICGDVETMLATVFDLYETPESALIPHARPGIAVGGIMTFMLSAGSYAVPYIMTRGTAAPWFTQLIYNRFFEATNWNVGAAYALSLLAVCTLFIFGMMRLLKVSLKDIAK